MFSRFTASARRVMQRAFREAKRWQHDFVGTEHLLFGLLCDADGPAAALLRAINANPDLVLRKVELSLQRHDGGMALEQFPLSPASRRVFHAAADEAALFHHQMIGPEHLLLGLLRESECEAAQILANNGIAWSPTRNAIAMISPDAYAEAQILTPEQVRFTPGDNPSADELERWMAPPITYEDATLASSPVTPPGWAPLEHPAAPPEIEAQLRRTQLVLGLVMGFAFGYWLAGWIMGLVLAGLGVGLASYRSSWLGIAVGACCGLFLAPVYHADDIGPLGPIALGMLGGLLGSFLSDGWLFSTSTPMPSSPDLDPPASSVDDPAKNH